MVNQPCPNLATDPLLHIFMPVNQSLHPCESYFNTRLNTVIANEWKLKISDGSAIGYNLFALNSSSFPKIGIAISGGGYRAGVISALDARNQSAEAAGTGGLLQVTSYLSAPGTYRLCLRSFLPPFFSFFLFSLGVVSNDISL
jgi:lysophospholipase